MNRSRQSAFFITVQFALLASIVLLAASASGQTQSSTPVADHGALGSSYGASLLADLPTSDNPFALIETLQPSIMSDRFSQGMYPGQPARIGGFLASYTQTLFRVDGVDITDPTGSGAPFLFPDLALWQRIDVATGLMPAEINATGLAISLAPLSPSDRWQRSIFAGFSQGALTGHTPDTDAPAIARPDGWNRASVVMSGPLTDRTGAVFAGSFTGGNQFYRSETESVGARSASGFANLVFNSSDRTQVRTLGWVHSGSSPFDLRVPFGDLNAETSDTSFHVQTTLDRRDTDNRVASVYGAYSRRSLSSDAAAAVSLPLFDRVTEGSTSAFATPLSQTVTRWSAGVRFRPEPGPTTRRHSPSFGAEVAGSGFGADSYYTGSVGETVGGVPARLWTFTPAAGQSSRSALTLAVDASESLRLSSKVTIDAGIRLDAVSGSADGAEEKIAWSSWLPRASLKWAITDTWKMSFLGGYSRTAYRLPLDLLAIGDPNAPTANVFRWDGVTTQGLPLVARVGPGTGGDAAFTRIDPNLDRPVSDEFVLGFQAYPHPTLRLSFVGVTRRENNLWGMVNTGAPASAYDTINVEDGGLFGEPALLPVYNRRPETFGQDSYLLTTPDQDGATFEGFEIGFTWNTSRFLLEGGLTASIAEGPAANRGFRVDENDQSLAGELWSNPNATTFSTTRFFSDRAYTGKLASVIRFPQEFRLGVIARYQDGQPFSRIVIVEGLNQGTEGVRAYADGNPGTRFTFVGTVDVRLQKGFTFGGNRVDAILDIFNLPNMSLEVEEDVLTGDNFRAISAVQPPRAFHVGVRWGF